MVRIENHLSKFLLFLSFMPSGSWAVALQPDAKAQGGPGPTISVSVQEVRVDVGVYDKKGHRIEGLKKENFQIYEDDQLVIARSFRYLEAEEPDQTGVAPDTHLSNGNEHWNHNLPDPSTPLNVIFLDVLNEDFGISSIYPLRQIRDFLQYQLPFAQYAIYTRNSTGGIHLVHGFTSDRAALASALEAKDLMGSDRAPEENSFPLSYSDKEARRAAAFSEWLLYRMQKTNFSETNKHEERERQYAVSSCRGIVSSVFRMGEMLAKVPGRKNVLWLNKPLPLFHIDFNGFSCEAETREALAHLSLAGIVVYPIDIRGLATLPAFDVSTPSSPSLYIPKMRDSPVFNPVWDQNRTWLQDLYSSHFLQDMVAEETGGDSFQNSNKFAEALKKAASRGNDYYTLTYTPAAGVKEDGRLHRIRVDLVGVEGTYSLKYRHSYRGLSASSPKGSKPAPMQADQLLFAVQHGAPLENGVSFGVSLEPTSPPRLATKAELRELSKFPHAMTDKSGKQRKEVLLQPYRMTYSIPPSETSLSDGDEKQEVSIDTALIAYSGSGGRLMGAKMTVAGKSHPEPRIPGETPSIRLHQELVVPIEARSVRVVVKNRRTGAIGSIEIDLYQEATGQRAALR